jgi:hypothetical protein
VRRVRRTSLRISSIYALSPIARCCLIHFYDLRLCSGSLLSSSPHTDTTAAKASLCERLDPHSICSTLLCYQTVFLNPTFTCQSEVEMSMAGAPSL